MDGQAPSIEPAEELPEAGACAVLRRQRAVPGAPGQPRARPADLLLGHHDRIEALAGDVHREGAELADREAHALEQIGVLAHEELGPVVAARLLVDEHAQDQIARRSHLAGGCAHERREHHRDAALHVERAAPPHVAVVQLAARTADAATRRAPQPRRRGPATASAAPLPQSARARPGWVGRARSPPDASRSRARRAARGSSRRTRPRCRADSSCRSGSAAAGSRPGGACSDAVRVRGAHGCTVSPIGAPARQLPRRGARQRPLQRWLGCPRGGTTQACPAQCGPERSASAWSPYP